MNNQPSISVLMCAHNAAKYIRESIRSVLDQSFANFELVIVDDESTDDTVLIVKSFADSRIRLVTMPRQGLAGSLNFGLSITKAEYVARFDADDICHRNRLDKQYTFLREHPEYSIVGTAANYVDKDGQFVFTYHPPDIANADSNLLAETCPFIHSSVMYRKEPVIRLGYHLQAVTFEDHLLWMQMLKEHRGHNIQEPMLTVRLSPESVTMDKRFHNRAFQNAKRKMLKEAGVAIRPLTALDEYVAPGHRKSAADLGAYYTLLAKKYLWNNHQPEKARANLRKAISQNVWQWRNYLMYGASFLSATSISRFYQIVNKKRYASLRTKQDHF